jgi:hypothetical protein
MRVYGYAAEILGLSPFWQRRPRLQGLLVLYEAFAADGQVVAVPMAGSLSTSWAAISSYFSQYLQARGQRQSALGPSFFALEICAAKDSQVFEARLREGLSDPSLIALLLVCSAASKTGSLSKAVEPANPALVVHRIDCDDPANPVAAATRRQVYLSLLTSLPASAGPSQESSNLSLPHSGVPLPLPLPLAR